MIHNQQEFDEYCSKLQPCPYCKRKPRVIVSKKTRVFADGNQDSEIVTDIDCEICGMDLIEGNKVSHTCEHFAAAQWDLYTVCAWAKITRDKILEEQGNA